MTIYCKTSSFNQIDTSPFFLQIVTSFNLSTDRMKVFQDSNKKLYPSEEDKEVKASQLRGNGLV